MSKIGKKPIILPSGVTVTDNSGEFLVKGPKGEITVSTLPYLSIVLAPDSITVELSKNIKQGRSNWGTLRSLLNNAVIGVTEGFSKELEINGVGYRAEVNGSDLILNLGFSHPVKFSVPSGLTIAVEKNIIKINGADKNLVGRTAAEIRSFRKPEPYKGKGIKYVGEVIIRKAGKKVGAGS